MSKGFPHKIAECVGLWLAEGDNKTKSEITFTNNCLPLVIFFYKVIKRKFSNEKLKPRVYVYRTHNEVVNIPMKCKINYYQDIRARKPYYIYRVASVNILKEWKKISQKQEVIVL